MFAERCLPQRNIDAGLAAKSYGLEFSDAELSLIKALDTPVKVQDYLNTLRYNNDFEIPGKEDTAYSPKMVMKLGRAHCFEAALLAYMVNFLHGRNPKIVVLEGFDDSDHNLCVFQDPESHLWGANEGGPLHELAGYACFSSLTELVNSYARRFGQERKVTPIFDQTFGMSPLQGYSQPIDLVSRYGVQWMDTENQLWDIFHTYVDRSVSFFSYFSQSHEIITKKHIYPFVLAQTNGWIKIDRKTGQGCVNLAKLPKPALSVWQKYWKDEILGKSEDIGEHFIQALKFSEYIGTTPKGLLKMASVDLPAFEKWRLGKASEFFRNFGNIRKVVVRRS